VLTLNLAEANRLMFESFTAPDLAEGVHSFLERRPPKIRDHCHPAPGRVALR
jgi:hypothetical protein